MDSNIKPVGKGYSISSIGLVTQESFMNPPQNIWLTSLKRIIINWNDIESELKDHALIHKDNSEVSMKFIESKDAYIKDQKNT
jgi:hypothetical protein